MSELASKDVTCLLSSDSWNRPQSHVCKSSTSYKTLTLLPLYVLCLLKAAPTLTDFSSKEVMKES